MNGLNTKIKIPQIKAGNPFLPSPDEVSKFLGFPSSPRERIKWANAAFVGASLPTDRTLDNISNEGIRWKSIRSFAFRITKIISKKGLNLRDFLPSEDVHKADLSFFWSKTLIGLQQGLNSTNSDLDISPIIQYVDNRCAAYQLQFDFLLNSSITENENLTAHISGYYLPVVNFTLLNSGEKRLVECWLKSPVDEVNEETTLALGIFFHDFWLSLMAVLDNIIIRDWGKFMNEGTTCELLKQYGVFGIIFKREETTYLGKFFSFIKEISDQNYSQLSTNVPLAFSEYKKNGVSRHETQRERFKEWRNGKSIPSVNALNQFFSTWDFGRGGTELLVCGIFMRALDVNNTHISIPFCTSIRKYDRYYKHYQNRPPNS